MAYEDIIDRILGKSAAAPSAAARPAPRPRPKSTLAIEEEEPEQEPEEPGFFDTAKQLYHKALALPTTIGDAAVGAVLGDAVGIGDVTRETNPRELGRRVARAITPDWLEEKAAENVEASKKAHPRTAAAIGALERGLKTFEEDPTTYLPFVGGAKVALAYAPAAVEGAVETVRKAAEVGGEKGYTSPEFVGSAVDAALQAVMAGLVTKGAEPALPKAVRPSSLLRQTLEHAQLPEGVEAAHAGFGGAIPPGKPKKVKLTDTQEVERIINETKKAAEKKPAPELPESRRAVKEELELLGLEEGAVVKPPLAENVGTPVEVPTVPAEPVLATPPPSAPPPGSPPGPRSPGKTPPTLPDPTNVRAEARAAAEAFERGGGDVAAKPGGPVDVGTNLPLTEAPPELKGRMSAMEQELTPIQARGEVRHNTEVVRQAQEVAARTTPEKFLADVATTRRRLSDGELYYLRQVDLGQSGAADTTLSKWKAAVDAGASPEVVQQLRSEYQQQVAKAINSKQVRASAQTPVARALQQFSIPVEGVDIPAHDATITEMQMILDKTKVPMEGRAELLPELVELYHTDPPAYQKKLRSLPMPVQHRLMNYFRGNLLSAISAPRVFIGNATTAGLRLASAELGGRLRGMMGDAATRNRFAGDAAPAMTGMLSALPGALRNLGRDLVSVAKLKDVFDPAATPLENFHMMAPFGGPVGQGLHTFSKLVGLGDKFFRPLMAQGELFRLANAEARRLEIPSSERPAFIEKFLSEVDAGLRGETLNKASEFSRKGVYQQPLGPVGDVVQFGIHKLPLLITELPFFRSMMNIADVAIDLSPAGTVRATWKGSKLREKMKGTEGQWTKDEIADRIALSLVGTTVASTIPFLVKSGMMTGGGPSDPREKAELMATGWKPYAIKHGDTYYSGVTEAIEPLGNIIRMAADLEEIREGKKGAKQTQFEQVALAIRDGLGSYRFVEGLADFFDLFKHPEKIPQHVGKKLSSFVVPAQLRKTAQALDPVYRQERPETLAQNITRPILSGVPGATKLLPAKRTATGEEATREPGTSAAVARVLSPVQPSTEKFGADADVRRELLKIGYIPYQPKRDVRLPNGQRLRLDDASYAELQNTHKEASAELRKKMATPGWKQLPDTVEQGGSDSKEGIARRIFDKARDKGRKKVYARLRIKRKKRRSLKGRRRKGRRRLTRKKRRTTKLTTSLQQARAL